MAETYAVALAVVVSLAVTGLWLLRPELLPPWYVMVGLAAAWARLQRWVAAGPSCFTWNRKERRDQLHFHRGEVAIVTGANSGIGFYTALRLAEMGCKVVITCRTEALVTETIDRMRYEFTTRRARYASNQLKVVTALDLVSGYTLELDSKASITSFVAKFQASGMPCNILVNNAGMMVKPLQFSKQNPNLELHTAVNFIGPVLLTELLMPIIKASLGRVVLVASEAHRMPEMLKTSSGPVTGAFVLDALKKVNRGAANATGPLASLSMTDAFVRYGTSKLCNVYHAHYIATVHKVPVSSLHPGVVATGFLRPFPWLQRIMDLATTFFLKTCEEGAETTLACCMLDASALAPIGEGSVKMAPYFVDCANETKRLLRPIGWDKNVAIDTVTWALDVASQ